MTTTRTLASFSLRPLCRMLPLLIAAFAGANVSAMPTGATVVNGQVTFSYQGKVFSITNSPNAIINWAGFSIRQGELVRFIQQSNNSSVLNRITGQNPSLIMGALQSNGRVYLINPNGIVFGRNAQVDVNGLVASTLNITNQDFINQKNKFVAGPKAGKIVNYGAITTPSGGQVFLIASNVSNNGIITSPQGEIVLAAGRSVQLADSGNPDMHVVVSAPADQALNLGEVIAQGGKVGIYGALINQRGTINANSAVVGQNGKIVLKASGKTLLEAGSVTTATGTGTGGEVHVLGKQVGLMGDALVDVSGQTGGGTALIGGDYQGKNAAVMNAEQTFVGKDATIKADAIVKGNGGKVIVWGNQTAQVYGSIFARGGALSGNGGFIETSGNFLDVAGIRVNAGAPKGKSGQWLLDPLDIVVTSDLQSEGVLSDVSAFATDGDEVTEIFSGTISEAIGVTQGTSVILQAKRDITFNGGVFIDMPNIGLTAQAGNDINVNAMIRTNDGVIVLSANDNAGGTASGSGRVRINQNLPTDVPWIITDSSTQPPVIQPPVIPPPVIPPKSPPSVDICTITPNSALCQILSPPTVGQPNKPVQQASNEVIKTVTTSTPKTDFDQIAFLDTKKNVSGASGGSASTSSGNSSSADAADGISKIVSDVVADALKAANESAAELDAKEAALKDALADAAASEGKQQGGKEANAELLAKAEAAKAAAADAAAKKAAAQAALDAANKAAADAAAAKAAEEAAAKKPDGKKEDGKTADDKKSDKTDTKEIASTDKSGTKNEPTKKMYCN